MSAMLPFAATAQAAGPSFTCDGTLYLTQGSQLFTIDRSGNPFTFPALGASGLGINALGYNPADNYLYALRTQSTVEGTRLYQIDATGSRTDLGLVAGLPAPTGSAYFSGAFTTANDNILYVMTASLSGNTMYRIDVTTRVATPLTLSRSIYFADLDYANGLFYAYESSGQLVSINPTTGAVTNIGPPGPTRTFGAFYTDSTGLYGVNNSGGFYRFDVNTGQQTLISDAPPSGSNDGARCPLASPLAFDADLAITKTDSSDTYRSGSTVVYTIVVSNNGPFGAQNAHVQDALPAGVTAASWTCTASNGAVCRTVSGSGAIDARVDLPFNTSAPGATATFTLTMTVPATFTGDLVNTASVTPSEGNIDPVPGNNAATDTDRPQTVDLSVTKTNTPAYGALDQSGDTLSSGATTAYSIVVRNNGPDAVTGAILKDPIASRTGLTCTSPPTCSGGACPAGPLTVAGLDSGLVLGTLANGASMTVTLTCTVQ